MKTMRWLYPFILFVSFPYGVHAQDNGNNFNLVWADPEEIVGGSAGFHIGRRSEGASHHLLVVDDYDGNGYKEIVGWDGIDEHFFVVEANGDNSFGLKKYFAFFPYFLDLNDDGIQDAFNLDFVNDPDSVVIQLVNYDAALDSFVIGRNLGKFPKPPSQYLLEFYVAQGNFDDDPNSETIIYSFDRWANPYGGVATYLVVFELTSNDVATAGIKIEHLETINATRFQVPATITSGDLDHDGQKEMILVSMERKRIFIYESRGEDQYEFVYDTGRYAREAQHTYVSLTYVGDLDKDGLDDLWFCGAHGTAYVIPGRGNYDSTFTYENSAKIYTLQGATQVMAGLQGDLDADGKPNMYWHDLSTESIFELEYQGGDLRDPANYIYTQIYHGNLNDLSTEIFLGMNIGGLANGAMDLDKDGKRDFVIAVGNFGNWPRLYVFESVHNYTTGITERKPQNQKPSDYALLSGFPNPIQSRATLEYELSAPSLVTINLYNVRGQLVRTLEKGFRAAGRYQIVFDAEELPSGMYFARLVTNFAQKMMKLLVKK